MKEALLLLEESTTGAFAASGRVYTSEACAAPEGVYTIGA
jgi:hypothetical protein